MVGKPKLENWLKFIRPHRPIYLALGRGDRRDYIEKLSEKTKSLTEDGSALSDNSLRRYIAAAGFLEEEGITDLPPGGRLPLGAVENVMRIAAVDPSRRRELLDEIWAGRTTIDGMATKLEAVRSNSKKTKRSKASSSVPLEDMAEAELARMNFGLANATYLDFGKDEESRPLSRFFESITAPCLVIRSADGPPAVAFDSRKFGGKAASFSQMRKEFLRNVMMAAGLYRTVLVHAPEWREEIMELSRLAKPSLKSRILLIG